MKDRLRAEVEALWDELKIVTDTLAFLKGEDWETVKNARAALRKAKEAK